MKLRLDVGVKIRMTRGALRGATGEVVGESRTGLPVVRLNRDMDFGPRPPILCQQIILTPNSPFEQLGDVPPYSEDILAESAASSVPSEEATIQIEAQRPLSIYEQIQADIDLKKPKYTGMAKEWKAQGLCPHCGEKGRFSHFAFVCSVHREY